MCSVLDVLFGDRDKLQGVQIYDVKVPSSLPLCRLLHPVFLRSRSCYPAVLDGARVPLEDVPQAIMQA